MDLSFTEEQVALRDLARQVFTGMATTERLKEIEAEPDRIDRVLWAELARGGFLELDDLLDICVLLEEQGRAVAPVPLWPTLVARLAADGRDLPADAVLSVALPSEDPSTALVPAAFVSSFIVAPKDDGLVLVDASAAPLERGTLTSGDPVARLRILGDLQGEPLEHDASWLLQRATLALCALQVGVAQRQIEITAAYVGEREQFDRPLGSFQAVQQRLADAYIDVQAMRWTMWQAGWKLGEGLPASEEVAIAKFWASDAGARVSAAAQHLHGGIGVDVEYPLYRYTLWSKQNELLLGSATRQLSTLGAALAAGGGPA
ncbi:MAG: acyl-CoA dehydrogenase family protein [Actinomycetota bacterium]